MPESPSSRAGIKEAKEKASRAVRFVADAFGAGSVFRSAAGKKKSPQPTMKQNLESVWGRVKKAVKR